MDRKLLKYGGRRAVLNTLLLIVADRAAMHVIIHMYIGGNVDNVLRPTHGAVHTSSSHDQYIKGKLSQ